MELVRICCKALVIVVEYIFLAFLGVFSNSTDNRRSAKVEPKIPCLNGRSDSSLNIVLVLQFRPDVAKLKQNKQKRDPTRALTYFAVLGSNMPNENRITCS